MYIYQTPCSQGWSTNSFVTHSVTRWVTLFLKGTRGQWKMLYKGQWKVPSTQRLTLCGRHLFIDPYTASFIDPYTAFSLTLSQNLCEVVKLVGGESDINGATLSIFFWIYSALNQFWVGKSHFSLYNKAEQGQGSHSGLKTLWGGATVEERANSL